MEIADYAEGKTELPHELELAFYAKDIGALPEAGGVYDQPAGLLRKMRISYNIFNAWTEWKRLGQDSISEWIQHNPGKYKIVNEILEMRNG